MVGSTPCAHHPTSPSISSAEGWVAQGTAPHSQEAHCQCVYTQTGLFLFPGIHLSSPVLHPAYDRSGYGSWASVPASLWPSTRSPLATFSHWKDPSQTLCIWELVCLPHVPCKVSVSIIGKTKTAQLKRYKYFLICFKSRQAIWGALLLRHHL